MKKILSFLILFLIYGTSHGADLGLIVQTSYVDKIKVLMESIIDQIFFGLGAHQYEDFRDKYKFLTVSLIQLYMHEPERYGVPKVTLKKDDKEIIIKYENATTKKSFCFSFDTIAIQNWLMFSTSSYAIFTVCANSCELRFALKRDYKPIFKCDYTIDNVILNSTIGRIFGFQNTLKGALQGTKWTEYIVKAVDKTKNILIDPMIADMYYAFNFSVSYPQSPLNYDFIMIESKMENDNFTVIYQENAIDKMNFEVSNSDPPKSYKFNIKLFEDILNKATKLDWYTKFNDTNLPSNIVVRLNTTYFKEVIPDLPDHELNKALQAEVRSCNLQANISYDSDRHEIHVDNINFEGSLSKINKFGTNDLFLKGKFVVNLVIKIILKGSSFRPRLLGRVIRRDVKVLELIYPNGYETIKGNMERIMLSILDGYFLKLYQDNAMGEGIMLSKVWEEIDIKKSNLTFNKDNVIVNIAYKTTP